ncbi:MAG: transcription antitermination factor NusB [Holosporales bacterium]|jgi:N utilization substance protein B|nr:transcription antitermination factor NusB [Holosporales bacterium]
MESRYTIKGSLRRAARLAAVQLLYQIEQSEIETTDAFAEFEKSIDLEKNNEKKNKIKVDFDFLRKILNGAKQRKNEIDKCIQKYLAKKWSIEKLPLILKAILQLSLYEIFFEKIPRPVVINEYIEITREFFQEPEVAFVNGFLDNAEILEVF